MFISKSLKMALNTFENNHHDHTLGGIKESTSEYQERCSLEHTKGVVFVIINYISDIDENILSEGYAIFRIDHSSGIISEIDFGISEYTDAKQKVYLAQMNEHTNSEGTEE